jgi:4-amino-4-deoxy-L-arabinose transferase-like glycosyltransferase
VSYYCNAFSYKINGNEPFSGFLTNFISVYITFISVYTIRTTEKLSDRHKLATQLTHASPVPVLPVLSILLQ